MSTKSGLIVSPRGQITLPAGVRKKYGIKDGGMLTMEERQGEIILRPATVLEVDLYSDDEIAAWDSEDSLDDSSKQKIRKKLGKRK